MSWSRSDMKTSFWPSGDHDGSLLLYAAACDWGEAAARCAASPLRAEAQGESIKRVYAPVMIAAALTTMHAAHLFNVHLLAMTFYLYRVLTFAELTSLNLHLLSMGGPFA